MIKVSVIVPVYNMEKYLGTCLSSLVRQSLKDIEIIVINDGSTDNSLNIALEYQNMFPDNITVISQENQGISSARNHGLEYVEGTYVNFLDSDDYVTSNYLVSLKAFAQYGYHIGQLLLTKEDFLDPHRTLNMRNTLFTLVDEGVVPIINENDSVTFDEISIGDNDNLSALTAILWSADLLVLFSDIDGVYTDNPKSNPDAKLVELVDDVEKLKANITIGATNSFGTGGIATKLEAAVRATEYGIPMILANGGVENSLEQLTTDSAKGTLFLAE